MNVTESLGALRRDVAFALRQLRRSLPFAAGVVLCLGFGVGASTTVFSWMEALVLRPLPAVPDVERLVTVRPTDRSAATTSASLRTGVLFLSLPAYQEWRAEARSLSGLAAASLFMFGVQADGPGADGRAEPMYGVFASDNYFQVVGVRPARGRALEPADDRPGAAPVAVVSHRLWQTRFGSAADIVGRRMRVNGVPVTVVGVTPALFGGTLAGVSFDLWVPLNIRTALVPGTTSLDSRTFRWLDAIGRLAPGVERSQAAAELREIGARRAAAYAEEHGHAIRVEPLDMGPAEQLRPLFWALIGLTVLVVLIVCSNVANLLLVRAAARAREIAVRLSLGATRGRLVRQLMTENLVLAALGAAAGLVVTWYGRGLLVRLMPTTSVPVVVDPRIDLGLLGFLIGVTALAVLVFGLAPAVLAARVELAGALRSGGRGSAGSPRSRLRAGLVVAQFALSLTSLVCGALFLRRSEYLRGMDRGFVDPAHVLLVQTDMSFAGYDDRAQWQRAVDRMVERLAALPGARAVATATFVPLGFVGPSHAEVTVEGYAPRADESMRLPMSGVSPGYFDLMGVPIRQGRAIGADDTPERPGVAVVNETFARRYWPDGTSPLGRRITLGGRELIVVGVAKDGRYDYKRIDDAPSPLVYYAVRQWPSGWVTLHVRTSVDPLTMVGAARQAIAEVDPRVPTIAPTSLAEYTAIPMFPSRLGAAVLGVLSAVALALAATGLYAIIAYGVALRSREIGIRLALGGTGRQVAAIFLRETARLLGAGVAAGTALALATAGVLHRQLVVVPLPDAAAVAVPIAILGAVAMAAGFVPARRSARVEIARTLREE